jgi:hypothetical protein
MQGESIAMSIREALRDRYGYKIGEIVIDDTRHVLHDQYGVRLGYYDSRNDLTHDRYGTVVAKGNLLVSLLK